MLVWANCYSYIERTGRSGGVGRGGARAGGSSGRSSSAAGDHRASLGRGEEAGNAALDAVGVPLGGFGRTITLVALLGAFGGLYGLGGVGTRNAQARSLASTMVV